MASAHSKELTLEEFLKCYLCAFAGKGALTCVYEYDSTADMWRLEKHRLGCGLSYLILFETISFVVVVVTM